MSYQRLQTIPEADDDANLRWPEVLSSTKPLPSPSISSKSTRTIGPLGLSTRLSYTACLPFFSFSASTSFAFSTTVFLSSASWPPPLLFKKLK